MNDEELEAELKDLKQKYLQIVNQVVKEQRYEEAATIRDRHKKTCEQIRRLHQLEKALYDFEIKQYIEQNNFP